jgi:FMN reductase
MAAALLIHQQPSRSLLPMQHALDAVFFANLLICKEKDDGTRLAYIERSVHRSSLPNTGHINMSYTLKVVAVSGSLQRPSRTLVLVDQLLAALGRSLSIDARVISLGEIGPQFAGALYRNQLPPAVEDSIAAIESADLLLVASPVYRASYTGLFKHLFDFVHHEALVDKPVLLAATGGSDRHALVIDHQLRPLFSFFQARTLPIGVYAVEKDFEGYEIASGALRERIALAVERAVPLLRNGASAAVSFRQSAPEALAA